MLDLATILGGLAECRSVASIDAWWRDMAEHLAALSKGDRAKAEQAREAQMRAVGGKGKR